MSKIDISFGMIQYNFLNTQSYYVLKYKEIIDYKNFFRTFILEK